MMIRPRRSFGRDPYNWQREIDELIAELFGRPRGRRHRSTEPAVEFLEQDNAYLIGLEVPEFVRDELEVLVEGDRITVRGRQQDSPPQKSFRRRFRMGRTVPPEEVAAAFRDGILVVRVEKPPESTVRTIEVT